MNALLSEVLADALERLRDDDGRLAMLTVTAVHVDPDLRHATVLFASLGPDAREALGDHRYQLQAAIGREVRLKRTPTLSFAADQAIEAAERVEEALRRVREHDAAHGAVPTPEGDGDDER